MLLGHSNYSGIGSNLEKIDLTFKAFANNTISQYIYNISNYK